MRLENSASDNKKENLPPTTNTIDDLTKEFNCEDEAKPLPTLIERDRVREYLEKNPSERTEKDIQFLLDFMQHMPAFSNMTMSMKRSLCRVMVFAVVERQGTVVLRDGEKLDSWSVILNGHVEVAKPDGTIQHLHMGDSFGVSMTRDTMFQEGVMTTKSDDCQFVCIPQEDFYDILHREKENIIKIQDASGEVVMVMEKRESEERGHFVQGRVVLRGTPEMLMKQLIEDNVMDETYVTDFLLTYRTFMKSPLELADHLLNCLEDINTADKSVQVVHAWILSHYVDFEVNVELFGKLEKYFEVLKEKSMQSEITLLQQTCSDKARTRHVLFVLKNDEEPLQFILAGGQERSSKIFVSHVDDKSPASKAGLRVADQIISVNNHNLDGITLEKAYEFLQMTNHLMLTVRSNLLDFEKLRLKTTSRDSTASPTSNDQPSTPQHPPDWSRAHLLPREMDGGLLSSSSSSDSPLRAGKRSDQSPQASKLRQALGKMNLMQKSETCENYAGFRNSISSASGILDSTSLCNWGHVSFNQSMDLQNASKSSALFPLGSCQFLLDDASAIAVYRADQSHKHILVKKTTTVQEAIEAVLLEFEVSDPSSHYSLCQVTLDEDGTLKTKHLPNHVCDLAERATLNSRYYLRDVRRMEKLVTGDLTSALSTDVNFLQLPFAEVASQLTRRDMQLFRSVDPVEYVDDLFEISSVPRLARFSELVNEEMFWVVTEVCSEQNSLKRSKLLKQFIKIAEKCQKLKNFNSMFAILSGLGHGSVSRLRQTWEKLPDKYNKLFEEMQAVMDPSRNMLKYRNLLLSSQPPLIPFFPLVKKDLTFIHFGNDSRIEGLINFDKLRMIAKEIRLIFKMASVPQSDKLGQQQASKNSVESLISSGSSSSLVSVTPSKKFGPPFASSASLTNAPLNITSAKKIYEEGQTSRAVKTYIANLKIISDESKLSVMSQACESNGKSSRKPVPSSASIVCQPALSCEVTGTRFGSENPTAILKIMSLSETVKPSTAPVKIVSFPAEDKKSSINKNNKIKPHHLLLLPPLHLSKESSSVSNIRKNLQGPLRPSSATPSSNSSLSLSSSSSSSSSSSNENRVYQVAPSDKTITGLEMPNLQTSSSPRVTSQLPGDNVSSSTSSGICSLESAPSLRNHHHHQQQRLVQQHCNCCDVDIADELDNLPDDGVDDDDDDDYGGDDDDDADHVDAGSSYPNGLPFAGSYGSNGTLCFSNSSTPSHEHQSVDVKSDVSSPSSSKTPSNPCSPPCHDPLGIGAVETSSAAKFQSDAPLNGPHSIPKLNPARQLFQEESSSSPPLNTFPAPQKPSPKPPSYDELLSMKQNVPFKGSWSGLPRFPDSKSRSSTPGSADLSRTFGGVRSHSKCCCCSICFLSSYHHHHHHHYYHHHYSPRNDASAPYDRGGSGKSITPLQQEQQQQHYHQQRYLQQQQQQPPKLVPHGLQRPAHQQEQGQIQYLLLGSAGDSSMRDASQHLLERSSGDRRWHDPNALNGVVPACYQPYATVHEEANGELVTLV